MLGAMLLAPLADRIGRRRVIVYSCVAFGVSDAAHRAPSTRSVALLALRFFTGLGLGAALPNAIGLASEYAPHKRRALIVMFVGSGISLGAIGAGIAARDSSSSRSAGTPCSSWAAFCRLLLAVAALRASCRSRFASPPPCPAAKPKRSGCCVGSSPTLGADARRRDRVERSRRRQGDRARSLQGRPRRRDGVPLGRVLHEPAERLSRDQLAADVAERVRFHACAGGRHDDALSRRRRDRHLHDRLAAWIASARIAWCSSRLLLAVDRLLHVRDGDRHGAVADDGDAHARRCRRHRRAGRRQRRSRR